MMNMIFAAIFLGLEWFARAGGGGSSGSGGSYGGSSSSGSGRGDGFIVLFLLAAVLAVVAVIFPFRIVTGMIRKSSQNDPEDIGFSMPAISAGTVIDLIITIGLSFFAIWIGLLFFPIALIGVMLGARNWKKFRTIKRDKRNADKLSTAAQKDHIWSYEVVKPRTEFVFNSFQKDWSELNYVNMQTYLTPEFYQHNFLLLEAIKEIGRQDKISEIKIKSIDISQVVDSEQDDQDWMAVKIAASLQDTLVETDTNSKLSTGVENFAETWYFQRSGDQWLLGNILPDTAQQSSAVASLQKFATDNSMFYKLDMGRLLIPKRGELFGAGSFQRSDINNHIIGKWDDLLVQLYTLDLFLNNDDESNKKKSYLIGQISLPKSYGGIIIHCSDSESCKLFGKKSPKGYQKVVLEWGDFNKQYNVYATNLEQVTVFELLNPKFMIDLHDFNLPINIEVIDNVVYFYCKLRKDSQEYSTMLDVLKRAHKELKR